MALKLDIRPMTVLNGIFFKEMLTKLDFFSKVVDLFMACVTSAHYRICHAGREFGYIFPERCIRQGDTLSSYLFLVCVECFTTLIKDFERRKLVTGIQVAKGAPTLSHIFFADDSYVYRQANEEKADRIFNMLRIIGTASGQQINIDKYLVFFSPNNKVEIKKELCDKFHF